MPDDLRLIEDYLPIAAISAEASREKYVSNGQISTLHLWWARRPLVACRAAVYGALVPADRWVKDVELKNPPTDPEKAERFKNGAKRGLNRRAAAEFVARLCKHPMDPKANAQAQQHILEAHAQRLTREIGTPVMVEDIQAGRAAPPKVLDMFAGGGSIPLEALRLGCEAYALDLNPVAHIIELCTLVYPQKYGKPDPTLRGMMGPTNEQGETTWGGLTDEVRYWGRWVLKKVKAEIGDLYPLIPDAAYRGKRREAGANLFRESDEVPPGYLMPVAYLWTRTVTCKNPTCKATVPLVKQTWLCKKKGRLVALKLVAPKGKKRVRFEVAESRTEKGLGFDPTGFSKAGNATCPFCGTVAESDYVKAEGCAGRMGTQPMAVICIRPEARGKVYLAADDLPLPDDDACRRRIADLCKRAGVTVPDEPIVTDAKNANFCILYGLDQFAKLFTPRQMLCLLTFAAAVRAVHHSLTTTNASADQATAVVTMLACYVDRSADHWSSLCAWNPSGEKIQHTFGRQALPMVWDFSEANPWGGSVGDWTAIVENAENAIWAGMSSGTKPGAVKRGSATALPFPNAQFDAIITDPPYYDNVPYADISDFFYVWLKRTIGELYPEHFSGQSTPKKQEAVADATRYGGDKKKAVRAYEDMLAQSLAEAHRVLKPTGALTVVYAHKTTLGWSALVDAFRRAGFAITEAWPLDTENKSRLRGMESAALASSIFLIGRKRGDTQADAGGFSGTSLPALPPSTGSYETDVFPQLEAIVRERVGTLWDHGISGADLVIASVGAGLRAFTRFARVEYANGEEVPAERFLTEVESVVLDTILARLSKEVGGNGGRHSLAGVDPATRFYVLWRYTYKIAALDAGEAIVFANGTHVELDGHAGLSAGARALIEKEKGKYRLRDFTERGEDDRLGLPDNASQPVPLIDTLHRTLWLLEREPRSLAKFLAEAQPNRDQMRLLAQALAGPALKGGELPDVSPNSEQSALAKLTANWRSVIEDNVYTPSEQADRKRGQRRLFEK
jgi:putative DNA methylase